jgi:pyruvate kinase
MTLASSKTKLVCTIGPASDSPEIMLQMLHAGMNIARLNFSHGDFAWHKTAIDNLRRAARTAGKRITIMGDLPGPKIRIGQLAEEPIELKRGDAFTLTTNDIIGDQQRVFVSFPRLPAVVKQGDVLFLNDGSIQLEVVKIEGHDVQCRLLVGGELRSRKGLNLPGVDLGVSAFTEHDQDCLKSALENGVDSVSQSFVETPADVEAVRTAAAELGHHPFVIAKIERAGALHRVDEILKAADGIMIARGDLAVESSLETIAVVQKQLISRANLLGKPVITATQMLQSMVDHCRPTRAEATDVANAILDGTDCVMLSEESAMGKFPVEAVRMLAGIAVATEPHRIDGRLPEAFADYDRDGDVHLAELISRNVQRTVAYLAPTAVIVPTATGRTARMISRFKLPVWIAAASPEETTCHGLHFSYGVHPVYEPEPSRDWTTFARGWVQSEGLADGLVVLTEGPSRGNPEANHRLEIIDLRPGHVWNNEPSQHGCVPGDQARRPNSTRGNQDVPRRLTNHSGGTRNPVGTLTKANPLKELAALGQSIWLDYIRRNLIVSGELRRLIEEDGLRGMTSNPSIFEKAIVESHDYDEDIRAMALEGKGVTEIYEALSLGDVRSAADNFQPVYDKTDGKDGYVSLEVNPHLAHDTTGTIEEARRLWTALDRPNVLIKVPATADGLPAIQQLISEGISVNVTLLFGLPRYRQVADAYIAGVEARAAKGKPVKHVASVASFFVSRIDTLVDALLEERISQGGRESDVAKQVHGQVAVASAKMAYQIYKDIFGSDRFTKLADKGTRVQRLLWASTGTKNPDYSDVKYVESLIGPDTVNTVPVETLDAYRDHGDPKARLEQDVERAGWVLQRLSELGISIDRVTQQLEDEGVEKFNKPFDKLMEILKERL